MLIKAGVDISRLNREIRRALPKIQRVLHRYHTEMVITSTYEGNHGDGSLHYCDDAVDVRKPIAFKQSIKEELKKELGPGYDIYIKGLCIHVEWDPKN